MLERGWRLSTFRDPIAALPRAGLERSHLLTPDFHLCSCGPLEAFYAPLEWVNRAARVVLLGAAPGWHEMESAFRAALAAGHARDPADVLRRGRLATLPTGPIRQRLCELLDRAGIAARCGLRWSEPLFDPRSRLLHWTWVARYPVFVRGRGSRLVDYRGRDPSVLRSPLIRAFITDALAGELAAIPDALVIPIGPGPADALWLLVQSGYLDPQRVGPTLPEPALLDRHQVATWRPEPAPGLSPPHPRS
ncbi:MAG: hypothetical protein WD749_10345 [Phycisphaerales bacterium]